MTTTPTFTVPVTVTVTPTEVTLSVAAQTQTIPVPPATTTPPVDPPPATGAGVVYSGGKLLWGGDWSYACTINYSDEANPAPDGTPSLAVTLTGAWGGWQPYISAGCQSSIGECFNTAGYNYISFLAKARVANQKFKMAILSSGDTADGTNLYDLGPYNASGDNPPVGTWVQYKVPLSIFALTNPIILKFSIGDQTGLAANGWNLANVQFTAS
jgi:hypothetical protein